MFVLALSLYNTWNRGVFLLCKITNLLIYSYKEFGRGDNKNGCQKQKDVSIMFAEEKKGEKYLCCMKKSILETVDTEQGIQF